MRIFSKLSKWNWNNKSKFIGYNKIFISKYSNKKDSFEANLPTDQNKFEDMPLIETNRESNLELSKKDKSPKEGELEGELDGKLLKEKESNAELSKEDKIPKEVKSNEELSKEKTNKNEVSKESHEELSKKVEPNRDDPRKLDSNGDSQMKEKESKGNEQDLKNLIENLSIQITSQRKESKDSGNTIKIIGIIVGLLGTVLAFWYKKVEYDSKQPETYVNPLIKRIRKGIQPENPPFGKILPNIDLQEYLKSLKYKIPNKKKSCAMRIVIGQNHTGKTTAIMNELKEVENVLYLSFRESNNKTLSFEEILGEQLGIPSEITKERKNLPLKVLKCAIEKISEQGKQIVLILEDLNNVILYPQDYDKELKRFNLPDYLATFCNGLMQYVAFDKCQVIITISDPSRSSTFQQISGSNRIEYHSFVVARDEQVEKMLIEDVPFLKEKFGSFTNVAAQFISEKIGGDMGTLMRTLDKLENKTVNIEDVKTKEDVIKIVTESLSIPNKFTKFVDSRLVSKPYHSLHSEVKAALMIDTLLRCSNESKGSPLLLGENFFDEFKKSSPKKDVRLFDSRDLTDVKQILEEEDLFYKISNDDFYQPFRRILIEEWKEWESKLGNKNKLEATRKGLIDSQKIEFPKPEDIKRTCATLFGPKSRN